MVLIPTQTAARSLMPHRLMQAKWSLCLFFLSASGKARVSSGSSFLHSDPQKTGISSIKSLDSDGTLCSAFSRHREWVLRDAVVLASCGNILVFEYAWDHRVQLKPKQFGSPNTGAITL